MEVTENADQLQRTPETDAGAQGAGGEKERRTGAISVGGALHRKQKPGAAL